MSITEQENSDILSPHKFPVSRIAPYEFLLNDSPLVDDHFLSDRSWIPFKELDECDDAVRNQIVVKPFNLNSSLKD